MGHKIFVSYKYNDDSVQRLPNTPWYAATTVRDYVDILEDYIELTNHQYKGESDGEDLSDYSDDEIWEKLKDRIYDSSVTIVLISPNMKEENRYDKSQWIPWEIYYSLRETTRRDRTSHSNAVLAVVLPDKYGNYDYLWKIRIAVALNVLYIKSKNYFIY
ncbi:MAG: TIR domain-containing protein [Bacteroidales bacterium]|nr:TIR domain-containing protein [Bacteroidales bacterium]